jgi:glutamine cyclotransferase
MGFVSACSQAKEPVTPEPETPPLPGQDIQEVLHYTYRIINTYPHDPKAFTEGLAFEDGFFYEGTGRRGRSTLRQVVPETGEILQSHRLPNQYFGEGITLYHDRIMQLTWQSNVGFIYDEDSFEQVGSFSYPTEGWGITHDGEHLIMSDGSATLHFLDPETFTELHRIEVRDEGVPVTKLNELEYIEGKIYANVWLTDKIVIITPETGEVSGWIDLEGLLKLEDYTEEVDVLNGIAYDGETGRLFVTGKLWPRLFEIALVLDED